jgi:TolB-like protein/tetratricopeptide (TPR) repeat protein
VRLRRFLEFCVERVLAEPDAPLKEYTIGVEVFRKPASFDPRLDSIVRVEAHRLRAKLAAYYRDAPDGGSVKIDLPRRGYKPTLQSYSAASGPVRGKTETGPGIRSLALLPMANPGGIPEDEYFGDGLTEELIDLLTRFENLRMVAWNSSRLYRGKVVDLRRVGKDLGVEVVVEGSLRRTERGLRIGMRLVQVADGVYLWSETFERGLSDLFMLRREICEAVVDALQVHLAVPSIKPAPLISDVSPEVYHACLRGRHYMTKRTAAATAKAIECFEKAIATGSRFAGAHAGLASACVLLSTYGDHAPNTMMPRARDSARHALELGRPDAEAHAALGVVRAVYELDWAGAEREFRLAIGGQPGCAQAHMWYAHTCLTPLARFEEAFEEMRRVLELDPLSTVGLAIAAWGFHAAGRSEQAREHCRHALELEPHFYLPRLVLGALLEMEGKLDQALEDYREALKYSGGGPIPMGYMGRILARMGRSREALEVLANLREMSRRRFVSEVDFATVHLGLGDVEAAIECLYRAHDNRSSRLCWVRVDPLFELLRGHERFRALLRVIFRGQPKDSPLFKR